MKHDPIPSGKRKAVNVSLDTGIVSYARDHDINLSQVCEAALRQAARKEEARRWQEENRPAMEEWNSWLEKNGLPFASLRVW